MRQRPGDWYGAQGGADNRRPRRIAPIRHECKLEIWLEPRSDEAAIPVSVQHHVRAGQHEIGSDK